MIAQAGCKIRVFALTITMLGLISACASKPIEKDVRSQSSRSTAKTGSIMNTRTPAKAVGLGEKAAGIALRQVGVPYRYGGNSTAGFDCSGLVQYSYSLAGKRVARTTGQLWSSTQTIPRNNLRVGDLLFFSIEGKMSHVGLYVGAQRFVHAPSSGRTVAVESLNSPYYSAALVRVGRPP